MDTSGTQRPSKGEQGLSEAKGKKPGRRKLQLNSHLDGRIYRQIVLVESVLAKT